MNKTPSRLPVLGRSERNTCVLVAIVPDVRRLFWDARSGTLPGVRSRISRVLQPALEGTPARTLLNYGQRLARFALVGLRDWGYAIRR